MMSIPNGQVQSIEYKKSDIDTKRPSSLRPVYKMSVGLIDTYRGINSRYYANKAARLGNSQSNPGIWNNGYDDCDFNYIVSPNQVLADRYELHERVGKGSFGQVVRAIDREECYEVAVKIIKSRRQFMVQAKTEMRILTKLNRNDPNDHHNIVRLLDHFVHRGHQCFVFEKLSYNLYELLKKSNFKGVSLNLVRRFGTQILKALEFLARPDINIIHCDLKPENILLCKKDRSSIKVIDFGSSCEVSNRMFSYIQSRFYRSPEVLLGLPYDTAIDMWSLGCILVEMHTGEPIFSGSDEVDQLYRIIKTLGMPPIEMIERSPSGARSKFFDQLPISMFVVDGYELSWSLKEQASLLPEKSLTEIIGVATGGPGGRRADEAGHDVNDYTMFHDIISKMLCYDPELRISPSEALRHPFLRSMYGRADAGTQT